jgi:hypothetical protein
MQQLLCLLARDRISFGPNLMHHFAFLTNSGSERKKKNIISFRIATLCAWLALDLLFYLLYHLSSRTGIKRKPIYRKTVRETFVSCLT